MAVIDRHSDVRLAMVSVLQPGAKVHPNCGPYRGSIRVHVSVQTPNSSQCYIDVGGQCHVYRDTNIVAFDDTYKHSVANNTNQSRIVLFLDIDRRICAKLLTSPGPGCSLEVAVAPEGTACVLLHFLLACLLVYLEAAQESAYGASAAPPAHMAQLCTSLYFSSEHSNGTLLQYGSVSFLTSRRFPSMASGST